MATFDVNQFMEDFSVELLRQIALIMEDLLAHCYNIPCQHGQKKSDKKI